MIEPKAAQYHGRTGKLMGDGALMEFGSVVNAVTSIFRPGRAEAEPKGASVRVSERDFDVEIAADGDGFAVTWNQ